VGERALLYLVADGLGGHDAGKVASALAVEAAGDFVVARADALGKSPNELQATMKAAVEAANQAVFAYRTQHKLEMGTTLSAALLVDGKHLAVGHAGDTRVYRLTGGALTALTRDQTIAQDLVDDGVLAAEDAPNHRGANILTSTVGGEDEIDVQTGYTAVASGDRVLLCTDGLYRPLGDANIATGLTQWPDRHKTVRGLLRGALRSGSVDNVTAVVADVP